MYPDLFENPKNAFFLIAGPCVIEDEKMPFEIAKKIIGISRSLEIPVIFKASYRKANRSRGDSFTGIGDIKGLEILAQIKKEFNVPVITDIHSIEDAQMAADYVDVLQIPAFLCRQSDLLTAAAKTGKWVNVKKGQFLSPDAMRHVVQKIQEAGNSRIMLTERGSFFGYQDLVVDFRSIPIMQKSEVPVIVDVTHSLQQPNQSVGVTGGQPELIEIIAKAAIATGADGLFLETHPKPSQALSDGANMLELDLLEDLLIKLLRLREAL